MFLNSRYQYLLLGLCIVAPKSIIEVGLARGIRAFQMIQLAKKYNPDVKYTGYDVFDTKDISLINKLKSCLTNRDEIKKYL